MANGLNLYKIMLVNGFKQFATYRANIFAGVASALFMLAARYALWLALFSTGNGGYVTLAETMTYFVIVDILMIWTTSSFGDRIGGDIQSGDIAQYIIRPYSYHFQLLAGLHSTAVARTLTHSLPILVAALIFIGLLPPANVLTAVFFVLSAILGGVIYILVDLIISYSAFWLTDFWYISWHRRALFSLFGGTVIPLWFYPDWLLRMASLLPFQYALFSPLGIYLGRITGHDIAWVFAMQIFWICILFAIERLVWYKAQKKIVVQGG